jgi:hypothetical protein
MTSNILLGAVVSGILAGVSGNARADVDSAAGIDAVTLDQPSPTPAPDGSKHACKGQNACKGTGGCKTDKHACKAQNACKGQGGCRTDGK